MSLLAFILANCGFGSTRPHAENSDHSSKREIYFSNPKFNQVFHSRNPELNLRRKFFGVDSSDFTTNNNNHIVRYPIEDNNPKDYEDQDEGDSPDHLSIEEMAQVPKIDYKEDLKTTDRPAIVDIYENEKHPEFAIGVEEEKNSIKNINAIPTTKNTKKCQPKFKSKMAIQEQKILEYFSNLDTPLGNHEVDSKNPCSEEKAKNDTKKDVLIDTRTNLEQTRKNKTSQQDSADPLIAPLSKQPNTLVRGDLEDEGTVVDGGISIFEPENNEVSSPLPIISSTENTKDEKLNSDLPPEKNTLYVSTVQENTLPKPVGSSTVVAKIEVKKIINKPANGSVNSVDTGKEKVEHRNKTIESSTVAATLSSGTRFVKKNNKQSKSETLKPAIAQNVHRNNKNITNANIKQAAATYLQKWSLSHLISKFGNEKPLFTNEMSGSADKKINHKRPIAHGLEHSKKNPKPVIDAPKHVSTAPKHVTAAPKHVTTTPKRITAAHTRVTAAPKIVTAATKSVTAAPKHVTSAPEHVTAVHKLVTAAPGHLKAAHGRVTAVPEHVTAATKLKPVALKKITTPPRPQTDRDGITASILSKILGAILTMDTPNPPSHKRIPKDVRSHKNKNISKIVLSNIARNYIAPKYFPKSGSKVFHVPGESPLQTLPANFRQGNYELIHRNLVDSNMEREKTMSLADVFNGAYLRAVRSKKSKDYMEEFDQIM